MSSQDLSSQDLTSQDLTSQDLGPQDMSIKSWVWIGLVLGCLLIGSAVGAADDMMVTVLKPEAGQLLFGEVEISVEIFEIEGDPVNSVDFFVDDQYIDRLRSAPWSTRHDVGDKPVPHRFEVVATTASGKTASAVLVSKGVRVHLEVESALQQLYITVERDGRRVTNLDRGQFRVLDDGKEQQIVTFEGGDVPITALIMVDASDSMRGSRLRSALAGAGAFVDGMHALDQAQLLLFSDRIVHQTPFTNFPEVLKAGLSGVEADGGTSLDDHLFVAMERLEAHQGRRVIILLSDGIDVSSLLRMQDVERSARRSQALIYWIRPGTLAPGGRLYSAWRGDKEHRQELDMLETMVTRSGGRIVGVRTVREARPAFEKILQELREQYVIGYYPTVDRGDGAWHKVEVKTRQRGLDVRAREGYLDE